MQAFYNGGIHGGDIVLNTWSYHMVPAGCCMDEALRAIGAVVIPSGVGNTELQVEIMRDLKVTAFCGTTGFLMAIIKKAEEMGYSFKEDFCLEVAVAGGEMGGGPIRDLCENKYGLITSDFYGTVDVGVLAYECRERSGMHFTTDAFVEIVDSKTGNRLGPGEIGEVAATSFNEVYPLIRFGTGDLSYYENQPCLCGRTTPKLGKIVGRVGDAVRIRGMFVHKNQLDLAFQGFPEVSKYQIVVDRQEYRDTLAVRLELKKENIDKVNFKEKLGKKIQEICILKPDEIEIFKEGSLPEGYRVLQDNRKY
jgi:phenylacetate-CoA ligase